jgi:hypothetical protein
MTDLVLRLEVVAKRMEATLAGKNLAMLGTKHPKEVREAAAEITRLRAALAGMKERCAKVADEYAAQDHMGFSEHIAAAIRALDTEEKT